MRNASPAITRMPPIRVRRWRRCRGRRIVPGVGGLAPLLLILLFVTVGGCSDPAVSGRGLEHVTIGGERFHLEVAADHDTRVQGLSDRHEIARDGGMLFVFGRFRVINMVMRRCHVPIDVIFLDEHARVVRTHRMAVEPDPDATDRALRHYSSGDPVRFAIELAGGSLDRLEVKIGDRIPIDVERLRGLIGPQFP